MKRYIGPDKLCWKIEETMNMETIEQPEAMPELDTRATRLAGVTEEEKMKRVARVITLTITIVPFLGLLAGFKLAWGGISGLDIGLLVGLYSLSILGVTIGFHRMLTHGGCAATPPCRAVSGWGPEGRMAPESEAGRPCRLGCA
jgi:hypothetical protein